MPESHSDRAGAGAQPTVGDGAATVFSVLYEPSCDGFLCRDLLELVAQFASPDSREETVREAMRSEPAKQAAAALSAQLLQAQPQEVRQGFEQACRVPFDAKTGKALRDRFERTSAQAKADWGAIVGLAQWAGAAPWGGNEVRSFARPTWIRAGMSAHPIRIRLTCENCGQPAVARIALHDSWEEDWRIECPHCRFIEVRSPQPREVGQAEPVPEGGWLGNG